MGATVAEKKNSYRLHLGGHATASRCARIALARNLRDWGLIELLDDAELVTGELVANAAKLGRPLTLTLVVDKSAVIVEVTDDSERKPMMFLKVGDDESEDGRGLLIVEAIAM